MQIINGVKCRSGRESLAHIIKQAKKGKIGANADKGDSFGDCEYVYPSGNNCAVGSLFSKAQLKDIRKHHHNGANIGYVAAVHVGHKNLETVTGLKVSQLIHIQNIHDKYEGKTRIEHVIKACEEALQTGILNGHPINH
jgi:hypothetical protein